MTDWLNPPQQAGLGAMPTLRAEHDTMPIMRVGHGTTPMIAALLAARDRIGEQLAAQMQIVAGLQQECDDIDALIAAASSAWPG